MTTAVIIILFAAALIAVMAFAIRHEHAKRRIRDSFGPEYARVKDEHSRTRAVDRELARRIQMYNRLHLEPISADDRDSYATSWGHIRGGFPDDPALALSGAEQLIARLMAARGYPVQERGEQLVQGALQLCGEQCGLVQAALGQDADGRHVRQRLTGADVVLGEHPALGAEQVQGPDDGLAQAERQGVHRHETRILRGFGEPGPALMVGLQVCVDHGSPAPASLRGHRAESVAQAPPAMRRAAWA